MDFEVEKFAQISRTIELDYRSSSVDAWDGSPFAWIRPLPSRRKGAVGEKLVERWCVSNQFSVARTGDSEADRIISGRRVEIKLSTLWESGEFKFQQIRNQDYEFIFLLGLAPFSVHAWFIPKKELEEHVIGVLGQHTGASGTDTAWLSIKMGEEVDWLKPYGNSLSAVKKLISKLK